jgi:hypothetical protein
MISVSSIEEYFNIEIDNDYMQIILEDFLRTICQRNDNMYDYSSRIVKHYDLIIQTKNNIMSDEETEFRNMFKAIMFANCELQKNDVPEYIIKEIKSFIVNSDNLSFDLLKEIVSKITKLN